MIPLKITYKDIEPSKAISENIREHFEKIEPLCQDAISCRIVISRPHHHSRKGMIYHVEILVSMRGDTLVVNREPEKNAGHEDVYVSIRDAFISLQRLLLERNQRVHIRHQARA